MGTSKWSAALPANLQECNKENENPRKNLEFAVKLLNWRGGGGGECMPSNYRDAGKSMFGCFYLQFLVVRINSESGLWEGLTIW